MEGDSVEPRLDTSSDGDQMYTYFHRGEDIVSALEASGFSMIEFKRKQQASPNGDVTELFITASLSKG